MRQTLTCRHCGKKVDVEFTLHQLKQWNSRSNLIIDIFPEWTIEQREMLLSQTCNECWNKMFDENEY